MSDDVDLYDDLPLLNFGESISKIDEERQYFKTQLNEKEKDLNEIKEQFASLEKEKKILEENISSLYKTAVSEIKRKDQVIEELRREKDALIFRRTGRTSCNNGSSNIPRNLDNNCQRKSSLPTYHSSSSSEKSVESIPRNLDNNCQHKSALSTKEASISSERSVESVPRNLDNNRLRKSALPSRDTSISSEKSVESVKLSKGSKQILEIKKHSESTCDTTFLSNKLDVCVSGSLVNSTLVDEATGDYKKVFDKVNTSLNSSVSENFCIKLDDAASDKSSRSSERSYRNAHQSGAREHPRETKSFKNDRGRRSLSSEDRRDNRHSQNDYYSQHSSSLWSRHRSPHNRHRSSRSHNEKNRRDDRSWDRDDDRKYHRDFSNSVDVRDSKMNDELRRKHHFHSRRSPSPYSLRRYAHNPVSRYSNRQVNSRVNRGIKPPSENVRFAAQLKFKYSKAMRERSMSRTPVRILQKTLSEKVNSMESNSECFKMQNDVDIPKLKEEIINDQSIDQKNISGNEKTEMQPKHNKSRYNSSESQNVSCEDSDNKKWKQNNYGPVISQKHSHKSININGHNKNHKITASDKFSETLNSDLEKSIMNCVVQCNSNKKMKLDSLAVDAPCQVDGKLNVHNEKTTKELKAVLNNSDSYFTPPREMNVKVSVNESVLPRNEDSATSSGKGEKDKFYSQLSKTPPCKTLVPLKISPSFEDPALVKENKFSLCVFNEQCEFRSRRRRSAKLHVTETKSATENSIEKINDNPLNLQLAQKTDEIENIDSRNPVTDHSLGECVPENEIIRVNEQIVHLKNESEQNKGTITETGAVAVAEIPENKDTNQQKPTINEVELGKSDLKSVMVLPNSSKEELSKKKSPNRKRKLDSICEELKANLERKKGPRCVDFIPVRDVSEPPPQNQSTKCNDEDINRDKNIHSVEVHSDKFSKFEGSLSENLNQSRNHIIPKRRRKVRNLQDSVVQVLSQVKSGMS